MADITLGAGRQTHTFERNGEDDQITDFRFLYFTSTLDETQEVPPNVDIPAISGTGGGILNFARSEFNFTLDINGIDLSGGPAPDDMFDMHIHGAPVGAAGDVIFDFRNDAETVVNVAAGTVGGSWDTNEAVAQDMTPEDVAALLAEDTYFNIHTNRDTAGWIRGQILRDGTALDLIDLRELNIGSIETLRAITLRSGGDSVIATFFDDEATTLRLDGVSKAALQSNFFIFAGNVAEFIGGSAGRDDLFGAGGNDSISGRLGNDRLFGEVGNDRLLGGLGLDVLNGAAGADRFEFRSQNESGKLIATADRITDFAAGVDDIVLSAIDAATGTAGNQAFSFVGAAPFSAEGQVRVTHVGGDTVVGLNTTGPFGADMVIKLEGVVAMEGDDFLL
jgi:Ca2+-binding RTX toxin-like protein